MVIDWESELTRAALPRAVLTALSDRQQHGYAMLEHLRSYGFERTKGGTLYPLLRRLEEQGLVDHAWEHDSSGPGRKVFSLTLLGRQELERSVLAWDHMLTTLAGLQNGNGKPHEL